MFYLSQYYQPGLCISNPYNLIRSCTACNNPQHSMTHTVYRRSCSDSFDNLLCNAKVIRDYLKIDWHFSKSCIQNQLNGRKEKYSISSCIFDNCLIQINQPKLALKISQCYRRFCLRLQALKMTLNQTTPQSAFIS